jgi:hypothetical protein
MEHLFKSLTDREVNDYKRSSRNLDNLLTSAGELFRPNKSKNRTGHRCIS